MVKRIYVKKKEGFNVEAKELLTDIKENLRITSLENIIILNRYDVTNVTEETFEEAKTTVFSEPQVDEYYEEEYPFEKQDKVFGVEFLPGQFDQRAQALEECLQIIAGGGNCKISKNIHITGKNKRKRARKNKKIHD